MKSLLCLTIALVALVAALHSSASGQHDTTPAKPDESMREREGTRLTSQLGRFKISGDRLTFQPAGSEKLYQGLENLALERVGKVLLDRHDQADELQWEVSGVFTEYRGANYLLVTQALLKSKGPRSAPVLTSAAR